MKRRCAVCGGNHDAAHIYPFDQLLRSLEIEGRYAHPICVMDEQAKLKRQIERYGKGYEHASR